MMKKLFTAILFSLVVGFCFAEKASWKAKDYEFKVFYNKTSQPGDAVFVRMHFEPKGKLKGSESKTTGTAKIMKKGSDPNDKALAKSDFYTIEKNTVLTGIPLSTYFKSGEYELRITYEPFGSSAETFKLPLVIQDKNFISETIQLDEKNTDIKTNYSKERMDQINRLNAILGTTNQDGVWQTNKFVLPSNAKRITSTFGDRRVYAYIDGKSSTSLHYGKDYGVPTGTQVNACANGKVVMAEDRISTGWSVCIEHLPGLYSLYYHMSKLDVKTGELVKQGQKLGLSGATGLATGPHLHWEMRLNMEAVSPDFFTNDFTFQEEK